jgi:hypothetical protein
VSKSARQIKIERDLLEEDSRRRFYDRNLIAMSFCLSKGLTIYPSPLNEGLKVQLIVQRGNQSRPLNNIQYNQKDKKDVVNYVAAIDREYERLYLKMKDRA